VEKLGVDDGQYQPRPALRTAIRDILTADRESFRAAVGRLAADYGFSADRRFETPDAIGATGFETPSDAAKQRLWRVWVLEAAPIGIVLTGSAYRDTPLLYANRAARRLTGYSLRELIGTNLRRLQGPRTDPESVARLRTAIRNWNATTVEIVNYRADGTRFVNRVSLVPAPDATGTVEHWFGIQAVVPGDGEA
jgi:PAS domain S-box-containing protein